MRASSHRWTRSKPPRSPVRRPNVRLWNSSAVPIHFHRSFSPAPSSTNRRRTRIKDTYAHAARHVSLSSTHAGTSGRKRSGLRGAQSTGERRYPKRGIFQWGGCDRPADWSTMECFEKRRENNWRRPPVHVTQALVIRSFDCEIGTNRRTPSRILALTCSSGSLPVACTSRSAAISCEPPGVPYPRRNQPSSPPSISSLPFVCTSRIRRTSTYSR